MMTTLPWVFSFVTQNSSKKRYVILAHDMLTIKTEKLLDWVYIPKLWVAGMLSWWWWWYGWVVGALDEWLEVWLVLVENIFLAFWSGVQASLRESEIVVFYECSNVFLHVLNGFSCEMTRSLCFWKLFHMATTTCKSEACYTSRSKVLPKGDLHFALKIGLNRHAYRSRHCSITTAPPSMKLQPVHLHSVMNILPLG